MHLRLLKFVILILAASAVHAERLPIKIYTSADGLGSGFINHLMRDSRGFMWFCTRDGLSRFDGSRFINYQVGEKDSAPSVETIYETRDGTFWISTTGGTYRFRPDQITQTDSAEPRLAAEFVMSNRGQFLEDSRGTLWSNVFGFSRYVEKDGKPSFEKINLNLPPQPGTGFNISDMAETEDGSIWLNSSWGLVRRLSDGRTVYYPVDYEAIYGNPSMRADNSGRIWLAAADRILIFKPEPVSSFTGDEQLITRPFKSGSTFELVPGSRVPIPVTDGEIVELTHSDLNRFVEYSYAKRIFQTSDGDVWITAEDYLLHFSNGVYNLHTSAEGLSSVMARMAEDAAGNLWIAGQTGLARLDRNGLITFGKPDGANSERFFAITEDAHGSVYFAGRDFYLSKFEGGKFETVRPAVDPNSNYLWTSRFAYHARSGEWWILTNKKLYRFAAETSFADLDGKRPTQIYTAADGLKGNGMFQVFEDKAGNIWVSTRTDGEPNETGTSRLRPGDTKFQSFGENEGLPPAKSFSAAVEDNFGNIWFSFYSGGLARFNGERFEYFGTEYGFPANTIPDLLIDRKQRLWIASAIAGLLRMDDLQANTPTFIAITTADGLSSNNIRTISEDKFGRIYVGSVRGVDRLSPETGFIKHYSVNDGLAADFVVDSHGDRDGNLWFATNNGVSRLVPQPDQQIAAPQIFLGGLHVAGESQPISQLGVAEIDKGELSANQNNLQFDFFGLDFRAGETLRYQYKLEGANSDWSAPSDLHTVTFANLQPAAYRFLVRAVNSEGAVSANPAVVSFTILPPIYARGWFIAICVLFVAASVFGIERYRAARVRELARARLERLTELEQVRARIATDLHDDIGASLTEIAILSEVARQQQIAGSTNGHSTAEPLEMIYNVSNELVGTMSDIVWAINPQKDQLHDLTLRMRRFASDLLTASDIELEFEAQEDIEHLSLNSNVRREVFLIFKESINNIVKHSSATEVDVDCRIEGNELFLTVRDNGRGFDGLHVASKNSQQSYGGNGLGNMKRRAEEMGGKFEIASDAGRGTVVRLRLPITIRLDSDLMKRAG